MFTFQLLRQGFVFPKVACELYPSRVVALCLDPYCGLGLALWVLSSIYSGHQSILIPPGEVSIAAAAAAAAAAGLLQAGEGNSKLGFLPLVCIHT